MDLELVAAAGGVYIYGVDAVAMPIVIRHHTVIPPLTKVSTLLILRVTCKPTFGIRSSRKIDRLLHPVVVVRISLRRVLEDVLEGLLLLVLSEVLVDVRSGLLTALGCERHLLV